MSAGKRELPSLIWLLCMGFGLSMLAAVALSFRDLTFGVGVSLAGWGLMLLVPGILGIVWWRHLTPPFWLLILFAPLVFERVSAFPRSGVIFAGLALVATLVLAVAQLNQRQPDFPGQPAPTPLAARLASDDLAYLWPLMVLYGATMLLAAGVAAGVDTQQDTLARAAGGLLVLVAGLFDAQRLWLPLLRRISGTITTLIALGGLALSASATYPQLGVPPFGNLLGLVLGALVALAIVVYLAVRLGRRLFGRTASQTPKAARR